MSVNPLLYGRHEGVGQPRIGQLQISEIARLHLRIIILHDTCGRVEQASHERVDAGEGGVPHLSLRFHFGEIVPLVVTLLSLTVGQ